MSDELRTTVARLGPLVTFTHYSLLITHHYSSSLITHYSSLITLPPHRHSHDCFFVAVRPLKHTGQSSFVHHGHSLTDAQNFFHVTADHHDRYAAFSQAA